MMRPYKETLPNDIYICLMKKGPMSAQSIATILNRHYRGTLEPNKVASFCKTLRGQGKIGYIPDNSNNRGGTYYAIPEAE